MKEILAIAPQVGRILRPLCRIMGTPLPPHPAAARFPDTPAARAAARALAHLQAGLPFDLTKLSPVAYGYFVHPPRDDLCPPTEIGYARSRWPPKKRD
jgi:hypothetical protein